MTNSVLYKNIDWCGIKEYVHALFYGCNSMRHRCITHAVCDLI